MLPLPLLPQPPALLPVGRDLEAEPAQPQRDAQEVGEAGGGGQGREGGGRHGVEGDDGQADERAPGGLGHPGGEELGRGLLELLEAGVVAGLEDALEEVGAHCLFVWLFVLVSSSWLCIALKETSCKRKLKIEGKKNKN